MLVALAALVLVVEAVRHHDPAELLVMAGAGTIVALVAERMVPVFRQSPANFPGGASTTVAHPGEVRSHYRCTPRCRRDLRAHRLRPQASGVTQCQTQRMTRMSKRDASWRAGFLRLAPHLL